MQPSSAPSPRRFLVVVVSLAMILAVIERFQLEEAHELPRQLPLLALAFIAHALAPANWRLQLFILASGAAFAVQLGAPDAAGVIVIALALLGSCHLPVAFSTRLALVVASTVLLAALRTGWIATSWAPRVVPVVASLFMFRLMVYLFDLRHEKPGVSAWQRLAYFLMLPNAVFPLFPVIDYRTFLRTYKPDLPIAVLARCLAWMLRGCLHLLAHRVVYHVVLPMPDDVSGVLGVSLDVVGTYLLYLRISEQFHLIVGVMCLFGFQPDVAIFVTHANEDARTAFAIARLVQQRDFGPCEFLRTPKPRSAAWSP